LIDSGWQLKPLHRLLMTSGVYLRDSNYDADAAAVDPENRLLWRFAPRRLEAEAIRDTLLAVGGELDVSMFGPGTLDEGMKRRSIYFMVKRSALIPMLQILDAPEPLVSVGERPATTIAPQALLFMNNRQVRAAATGLARRAVAAGGGDLATGVRQAYQIALSRDATEQELSAAMAFLADQIQSYRHDGAADPNGAAMIDCCQILLSLNEFAYVQ
jgi:hypothetical protein